MAAWPRRWPVTSGPGRSWRSRRTRGPRSRKDQGAEPAEHPAGVAVGAAEERRRHERPVAVRPDVPVHRRNDELPRRQPEPAVLLQAEGQHPPDGRPDRAGPDQRPDQARYGAELGGHRRATRCQEPGAEVPRPVTLLPSATGIDTKASPAVQAKAERFIDFVLSPAGQQVVQSGDPPATRSTTRSSRSMVSPTTLASSFGEAVPAPALLPSVIEPASVARLMSAHAAANEQVLTSPTCRSPAVWVTRMTPGATAFGTPNAAAAVWFESVVSARL